MSDAPTQSIPVASTRHPPRRRLTPFALIGYAILGIATAVSLGFGSSEHSIGMALSVAPVFAFIAFSIALLFASRIKRPLMRIDLARIGLWAAVGYGLGVRQMANGYYRHCFPQYADAAVTLGDAFAVICLGLIVLSVFVFPTPKTFAAHYCRNCGYDLRGSPSRCPECGMESDNERA